MSTLALRLPNRIWGSDGRRITAIAAVVVLHLLLLGKLLMPQEAPGLRPYVRPEIVDIDPPRDLPPPPPKPKPEPEPVPILRKPVVTPPPTPVTPPISPPQQSVVPTTAHAETSDEPVVPVSPVYSAPAAVATPALQALTVLSSPPPLYPRPLIQRGIGGSVRLRILVGTDGRAAEVLVDRGSGHSAFDKAAQTVVMRRWRFKAALEGGVAVQRWGIVTITFRPGG